MRESKANPREHLLYVRLKRVFHSDDKRDKGEEGLDTGR